MQVAVDRRSEDGTRVPLHLCVQLAQDGQSAPYHGHLVDVGLGGAGMRAPFCPEVGSQVRCRIETDEKASVEAIAEVAWVDAHAHETQSLTAFGVRFVEVSSLSRRGLRHLVLGEAEGELREDEEDDSGLRTSQRVDVRVPGTDAGMSARVLHIDEEGVAIEHEMDVFRVGAELELGDTRTRVQGVDLSLERGTPKLLLDLAYADGERRPVREKPLPPTPTFEPRPPRVAHVLTAVPELEATIQDESPLFAPAPSSDADALSTQELTAGQLDAALMKLVALSEDSQQDVETPDAVSESTAARVSTDAFADTADATPGAGDASPEVALEQPSEPTASQPPAGDEEDARSEAQIARPDASVVDDRPVYARTTAEDALLERAKREPLALSERLKWVTQVGQAAVHKLRAAGQSQLSAAWARLAMPLSGLAGFFARLRATGLGQVMAWLQAVAALLMTRLRAVRVLVAGKPKRRTTSPAPAKSSARARRRVQGEKRGPRQNARSERARGRFPLIPALLGLSSLAVAVYAFIPEDPAVVTEMDGLDVAAPSAAQGQDLAEVDVADAPSPSDVGQAEPALDTTRPAVEQGLGLSGAVKPQAPGELPSASPYSTSASDEETVLDPNLSRVFGSDTVDRPRAYVLRMSQPVDGIVGTADAEGFSVKIFGALSLDRAGPIAATHPLIERSMVLNRGDHAELRVQFVQGQSPAYRVEARGTAVEVLVARR